jgi:hypothetical protein
MLLELQARKGHEGRQAREGKINQFFFPALFAFFALVSE